MKPTSLFLVLLFLLTPLSIHAESLAFRPGKVAGEYTFDTGTLAGTLRKGDKSIGLLPMTHLETGTDLAKTPGLVNYYRIFTTNHRFYPDARAFPCTTKLTKQGALQVTWEATEDRPFKIQVIYTWRDKKTLDLRTQVSATKDLPDFEAFLSSYHADGFPSTEIYAQQEGGPKFIEAEPETGTWQMLPRDEKAWAICKDGRWDYPPSPVDWARPADFAKPIVMRRHKENNLVVVLMAPAKDCISVSTCCKDEAHRSFYLSLFGRTLRAGETDTVHSRLLVLTDESNQDIVARYHAYLAELEKNGE